MSFYGRLLTRGGSESVWFSGDAWSGSIKKKNRIPVKKIKHLSEF